MVCKTHDNDPEPERYYDWMLWKMRQEGGVMRTIKMSQEDMWKKTVAEMQAEIHALQKTIVRLQEQMRELAIKEKDERQMEFDFNA